MTVEPKKPTGIALLRVPFEAHQISKLPKQAGWMADKKNEYRNCDVCGGWHHPKAVHLDYVGHAALTDRLLDADPEWNWEPVTTTETGVPKLDENGGMWIKLTVCGVTRLGYGHPDGKRGGDAVKEVIGDALRNAAMRFGAALDLWHKGDLHALAGEDASEREAKAKPAPKASPRIAVERAALIDNNLQAVGKTVEDICKAYKIETLTELTETQAASVEKRIRELSGEAKQ